MWSCRWGCRFSNSFRRRSISEIWTDCRSVFGGEKIVIRIYSSLLMPMVLPKHRGNVFHRLIWIFTLQLCGDLIRRVGAQLQHVREKCYDVAKSVCHVFLRYCTLKYYTITYWRGALPLRNSRFPKIGWVYNAISSQIDSLRSNVILWVQHPIVLLFERNDFDCSNWSTFQNS